MGQTVGRKLGPFEILGPLGSGGMGEVYRARDPKLAREVAIKVLSSEFSSTPEQLARFEQEARAASALNHPNIVTIYEIGNIEGTPYLVMELVLGAGLRELIDAGPISTRKVLQIAAQIAEGLAKAHAAGIIHRDLKPANIMVTRDGVVKILDFGLAKLTPELSSEGSNLLTAPLLSPNTRSGTILGTANYMSPEQAKGVLVDFRSDQFSFGLLLYEMITGKRAFARESAAQTLAAIIEDEPEHIALVNPKTPPVVRWIVERCLAKDPEDRYASTRDLARDLTMLRDRLTEPATATQLLPAGEVPVRRARLVQAILAVSTAGLGIAVLLLVLLRTPAEPPILRTLTFSGHDAQPAASPDARTVAFVSDRDGSPRIWLKQLGSGEETPLTAGPDGSPRFSPDGAMVLFTHFEGERSALFRVSSLGGEARRLVDDAVEGDWSPDGRKIAFLRVKNEPRNRRVAVGLAEAGGENVRELRTLDTIGAEHLRWSPDAKFLAMGSFWFGGETGSRATIILVSADGKEEQHIPPGIAGTEISSVAWSGKGDELIYSQGESSFNPPPKVPAFSGSRGLAVFPSTSSSTRVIVQNVRSGKTDTLFWLPSINQVLDIPAPGRLVFDALSSRENLSESTAGAAPGSSPARWLTRGNSLDRQPVYSPDGEWLAFTSNRSGNLDIWAMALRTGRLRRLTENDADDWDPAFTADGRKILWSSRRTGHYEIWMANSDGSGARQVSNQGSDAQNPSITPDGRWIVYISSEPGNAGIWKRSLESGETARLYSGVGVWPQISPNGEYVLYTSIKEGLSGVRIMRLADGSAVPFEIRATGGGTGRARWMPNGRGIAFVDRDARGAAGVFVQDFLPGRDTSSSRRPLSGFDPGMVTETFAISPDGRRITVGALEHIWSLMTADRVPRIAPPMRDVR